MAEKKRRKIATKVDTTQKFIHEIDKMLDDMSIMSIGKMTTGKMKVVVRKENDVITKDVLEITGELSEEHKTLALKIQELVNADLKSVVDGEVKVVFDTEIEIS